MECVKVIKVLKGTHSAFDHGQFTLEYVKNNWIYPPVGKIYAFQDYEHALRWAVDYPGESLWEAKAEIFKAGNCLSCTNEHYNLWVFWKWYALFLKGDIANLPSRMEANYTPNGTVLCERLMITKKLKDIQ